MVPTCMFSGPVGFGPSPKPAHATGIAGTHDPFMEVAPQPKN